MNSFWLIEDYIFANDFFSFFNDLSKKRKKSCFFENWKKNVKYVFSNTDVTDNAVTLFRGENAMLAVIVRNAQIKSDHVSLITCLWRRNRPAAARNVKDESGIAYR